MGVMWTVQVPQRVNRTKYNKVTVYKISVLGWCGGCWRLSNVL